MLELMIFELDVQNVLKCCPNRVCTKHKIGRLVAVEYI